MAALEPIGLSGKVAQPTAQLARQGLKRSDGAWLMRIPADVRTSR
jgi:hypothetical protein